MICAGAHTWRPENNFWESALSFHHGIHRLSSNHQVCRAINYSSDFTDHSSIPKHIKQLRLEHIYEGKRTECESKVGWEREREVTQG